MPLKFECLFHYFYSAHISQALAVLFIIVARSKSAIQLLSLFVQNRVSSECCNSGPARCPECTGGSSWKAVVTTLNFYFCFEINQCGIRSFLVGKKKNTHTLLSPKLCEISPLF